MKKKPTSEEILAIWNAIEDNEPDISTPRLSMMVCEHFEHAIDDSDVAEALLHLEPRQP
jgi:hypothetical protein